MSLARSASGPGGLTINTNTANLSTPSTQPAASGSLFGGATTNTPLATTSTAAAGGSTMATAGGLFGQPPKPAGSLFGGAATTPAASTGTGSLFGQPPKPVGSLFGGATTTPAANTGTGGLFGAAPTAATGNTGAGGLFGAANQTATQQPAQAAAGGLFGGAATTTNQPPAQATGGLFGGANAQQPAQQQPAASGGLFGAPAPTNNLFAQSQAKPATGGLFQTAQPQQQTQQPVANQSTNQISAVQINYDNIRPRTRFDDLAKPIQDEIALIDKGITRVIKMKDEIGEFMPQHERDIEQLGRDVKFVESKFRTVQVALNSDIQAVKVLQDMTKKNITDAQLSFKATDNLKLPAHYHQTGLFATPASATSANSPAANRAAGASDTHADAQDLITYFNRICDDVEKYKRRIDEYRAEIERDMPGVENGLYEQIRALRDRQASSNGDSGVSDQLGQVLLALREMGTAIINQAGQIADTRERLSRLQAGILDSGAYGMSMAV
ncbi:unnamed protein product [Clonostachys rosea f. rosea IK726]|uniref:Nucleoporin Nup54 alpha-helical domain-containing protein n=2 Tax=Bionectria ochroleuca TaxID=29856 RepID=A0A0B7K2S7_BIOOC|nr:unnamed protein product [Clonostachys rosea f. rosea IK726]